MKLETAVKENVVLNKILDLAVEFIQTRGYNAFSYRDLSRAIGIKTSSIHYYFPSKEDLGKTAIIRYGEGFNNALLQIDAEVDDPKLKLVLYAELVSNTLKSGKRICLCGMLATDFFTLPASLQEQVKGFYADNEAWLTKVLQAGRDAGTFRFEGSPKQKAQTIFALFEGALISARIFGDEERFNDALELLLSLLTEVG